MRRADVEVVELVGGVEKRELEVVDYDPVWVEVFNHHARRIRAALPDALIEHIGSTSVPGLPAKPIIDVVVGVGDVTAEEDYLPALLAAGYLLRVREPGHRLVRTPELDVHVHVYRRDDSAVMDYLRFRNRLRDSPSDRDLYASTKRDLVAQGFDDMNAYSDAKTEVVAAIMSRAAPPS